MTMTIVMVVSSNPATLLNNDDLSYHSIPISHGRNIRIHDGHLRGQTMTSGDIDLFLTFVTFVVVSIVFVTHTINDVGK